MILIDKYSPAYQEAHYEFASRYWIKRKRTNAEYLYWKFRGEAGKNLSNFLLAIDNGKVIGQLGLIPCTTLLGHRKIDSHWACELMVDHSYRGKGIAKALYDHALTLKPLTLGSDPSPPAALSMKRAGFRSTAGPYKFVFPIYLGEILKIKGHAVSFLDRVPNPFILILNLWSKIRYNSRLYGTEINEYDSISDKIKDGSGNRIDHSKGFSEWRFRAFKDFYNGIEIFACKYGTLFSLYRDPKTYIVTELLWDRISGLMDIASIAVSEAWHNGASSVKLLANQSSERWLLSFLGFIRFRTRTEIIFYCDDAETMEILAARPFYYTYLDSDENI